MLCGELRPPHALGPMGKCNCCLGDDVVDVRHLRQRKPPPENAEMIELIRREFEVELPLKQAWTHLAKVEEWASWARHIKKIDLQPPAELGPHSTGVIHLRGGMKSAFSMTEFIPFSRWRRRTPRKAPGAPTPF